MYRESQLAQTKQDELRQLGQPRSRQLATTSATVGTLLDRHLAAQADRAAKTVENARTWVSLTHRGRHALTHHLKAL